MFLYWIGVPSDVMQIGPGVAAALVVLFTVLSLTIRVTVWPWSANCSPVP